MNHFFDEFREQLNIEEVDPKTYSPLSMAFLGDAIYASLVKLAIVCSGNKPVNEYHKITKEYVKASEQAIILDNISSLLTEDEIRIVKWGRNAKSQSVPKHASLSDYQKATGLECLLGYLLLTKKYDRLIECVVKGIKEKNG